MRIYTVSRKVNTRNGHVVRHYRIEALNGGEASASADFQKTCDEIFEGFRCVKGHFGCDKHARGLHLTYADDPEYTRGQYRMTEFTDVVVGNPTPELAALFRRD